MRYRMRDKIGYQMEWDILVYDGIYIIIYIYVYIMGSMIHYQFEHGDTCQNPSDPQDGWYICQMPCIQ